MERKGVPCRDNILVKLRPPFWMTPTCWINAVDRKYSTVDIFPNHNYMWQQPFSIKGHVCSHIGTKLWRLRRKLNSHTVIANYVVTQIIYNQTTITVCTYIAAETVLLFWLCCWEPTQPILLETYMTAEHAALQHHHPRWYHLPNALDSPSDMHRHLVSQVSFVQMGHLKSVHLFLLPVFTRQSYH